MVGGDRNDAGRARRIAARAHSGAPTTATVHLDMHFVAPIHVGDVLRARPHTAPGTRFCCSCEPTSPSRTPW
ncbi:hotdog domain-containing protein [Rhodococcus sp. ZPP]|uniref:hotdog domain-containing protein n=1 Tax=Rhodococcus sp. ZPP TaxID=2749906 RepID=UPI003296D408